MSQLSHAQFPLRRHPHLLVDHRRAGSASVADSRGADAVRLTGSGGRLHFGMVAGFKSERWPASNRNRWPDCVGIRSSQKEREAVAADLLAFGARKQSPSCASRSPALWEPPSLSATRIPDCATRVGFQATPPTKYSGS